MDYSYVVFFFNAPSSVPINTRETARSAVRHQWWLATTSHHTVTSMGSPIQPDLNQDLTIRQNGNAYSY